MDKPTQKRVRELFDYRNGELYWKVSPSRPAKAGTRAGSKRPTGYRMINVDRHAYPEHWIVWLYHNGVLPKRLDHINSIADDNRIENLREVTFAQNAANRIKRAGTVSKYKGVCWRSDRVRKKRWCAQIGINGKTKSLGYFLTEKEAAKAYNKAARELFGEFARCNEIDDD